MAQKSYRRLTLNGLCDMELGMIGNLIMREWERTEGTPDHTTWELIRKHWFDAKGKIKTIRYERD